VRLWEDAEAHFEAALDLNARLGGWPWLARTEHGYAQTLLARHRPGDAERARELLQRALATARNLGMTTLAERAQAQLAETASGRGA
jgi:tetratricopeptide (TPR) repeat protein